MDVTMSPERTIAVIEVMNLVGSDDLLDIEHDHNGDDGCVRIILDGDRLIEIWSGNCQFWFQHNCLHRENSPAVIESGNQHWFRLGKRHREDGPAVIEADSTQEWWLNGKQLSEIDHTRLTGRTPR